MTELVDLLPFAIVVEKTKRLALSIGIPKLTKPNQCDTISNGSPNAEYPEPFFIYCVCGIRGLTGSKQGTKEQYQQPFTRHHLLLLRLPE